MSTFSWKLGEQRPTGRHLALLSRNTSSTLDRETAGYLRVQELQKNNNLHSAMESSASPSTATFGNDSSEGSNGLMALPAVMDMVADSQGESGGGGSVLFSDISTPARSWKQIAIRQESRQRDSAEEIIIFTSDPTGVAEEREVVIERGEIQIAHKCRVSRHHQGEEQDGVGDRGISEDT